ncbi:RHS repeat-associated core domain-containing protein [Blastococcus xanthinilyticus]|uniref:RHS repeat-associated protein n=1 Tax=Blastococcus xanthinilyticus TaxID=1564164 RepID=A0A5S5CKW4_9ACTN|nr:RHS repeat-associated core domain-containing protein [Blastococcus xanthinilyticus]TYP81213.1 RHS repeat-associated protein [Blastococcus xanthinilyticus]
MSATDSTLRDGNGLPTGASCTRRYGFDVNSNRISLTQVATAGSPPGTCPASVAAADGYAYDSADRLRAGGARASLRYDALGRTRVLPSVDTLDQGGDVALDYFVDDLVAGMSQAGRTTGFGLDAAARRVVRSDTEVSVPGVRRTTSLYSGDDDNPDVVKEPDNSWTRNIASFGGLAAVQTLSGTNGATLTLQLANLHGDVVATVPAGSNNSGDLRVTETTEHGMPWAKPAAASTQARYGWLGTHQRDASTIGGLTLMGVRLYAPTLGRFLTTDPVEGGNPNAYVYPADPVNMFDLDGRWGWLKKAWRATTRFVKKHRTTIVNTVGVLGVIGLAATGVGLFAVAGSGLAIMAGSVAWGAGAGAALGSAALCGTGARRGWNRAADCLGAATGGFGSALGIVARSARISSYGRHAYNGARYAARARSARGFGLLVGAYDAVWAWNNRRR